MTLSITTSKRMDLFLATIRSVASPCLDPFVFDRILVIDDNSSTADVDMMRAEIKALFGDTQAEICTSDAVRGHAQGMRLWYDKITGPYVFHCEDDWEFVERGCPILAALDVLANDPGIGQVAFSREQPLTAVHTTPTGTAYWTWEYDGSLACVPGKHSTWPCFTLNPRVIRVAAIQNGGNFV